MCNKIFGLFFLSILFFNVNLLSNIISDELFGIKIGTKYKTIAKNYKLTKSKNEISSVRVYRIIYAESFGVETFLYFFKSRIYKIKFIYGKDFADETDWENIYNQMKTNYGEYLSEVTYNEEKKCIETYTWQDEKTKQVLEKVSKNNNLETFTVLILDKKMEDEILKLSPLQKFWQTIISIF